MARRRIGSPVPTNGIAIFHPALFLCKQLNETFWPRSIHRRATSTSSLLPPLHRVEGSCHVFGTRLKSLLATRMRPLRQRPGKSESGVKRTLANVQRRMCATHVPKGWECGRSAVAITPAAMPVPRHARRSRLRIEEKLKPRRTWPAQSRRHTVSLRQHSAPFPRGRYRGGSSALLVSAGSRQDNRCHGGAGPAGCQGQLAEEEKVLMRAPARGLLARLRTQRATR